MWHLALRHVLGNQQETKVDEVPVPERFDQQSEITNNKISEGVTKEINQGGDTTKVTRWGDGLLSWGWKDLLE